MNPDVRPWPVLAYPWAAPCTLTGLVLAAAFLLRGGHARVTAGVLEVGLRAAPGRSRLPFQAITLGHVILGADMETLTRLRPHELVHVRQYECWGPLFFVAYPAASLYQWLRGRRPYWDNPFEVEARERSNCP